MTARHATGWSVDRPLTVAVGDTLTPVGLGSYIVTDTTGHWVHLTSTTGAQMSIHADDIPAFLARGLNGALAA